MQSVVEIIKRKFWTIFLCLSLISFPLPSLAVTVQDVPTKALEIRDILAITTLINSKHQSDFTAYIGLLVVIGVIAAVTVWAIVGIIQADNADNNDQPRPRSDGWSNDTGGGWSDGNDGWSNGSGDGGCGGSGDGSAGGSW